VRALPGGAEAEPGGLAVGFEGGDALEGVGGAGVVVELVAEVGEGERGGEVVGVLSGEGGPEAACLVELSELLSPGGLGDPGFVEGGVAHAREAGGAGGGVEVAVAGEEASLHEGEGAGARCECAGLLEVSACLVEVAAFEEELRAPEAEVGGGFVKGEGEVEVCEGVFEASGVVVDARFDVVCVGGG
jgi:hypothetical protein